MSAEATSELILDVPQGRFELHRSAIDDGTGLRAWDAADEYLLGELHAQPPSRDARVLLVNDRFGALACGWAPWRPQSMSDSYLAQQATRTNLRRNGLDGSHGPMIDPLTAPSGPVDVVVMRVPKANALLAHQLAAIKPHLAPDATVSAGGMTKQIHTSTIQLFERLIGPTTTSLAKKKARLIHARSDGQPVSPTATTEHTLEPEGLRIVGQPGVFAGGRVDTGTRVLLDHLRVDHEVGEAVDFGCGDGTITIALGALFEGANVLGIDESHLAVASTAATIAANPDAGARCRVNLGGGVFDVETDADRQGDGSVDLIVSNPPFHGDRSRTDATAWHLFVDAHRALRPGGSLWIVGNRNLGYHAKIKRVFGNAQVVSKHPTFVVVRADR